MKNIFFKFLSVLTLTLITSPVFAAYDVTINEGDLDINLHIDDNKKVQILGLPTEDTFFYDAYKKHFIVKPKGESIGYVLHVKRLAESLPKGELYSPLDAPLTQELGFNTRRWNASVYGDFCHAVEGSTQMADKLGLSYQDMKFITVGIGYVFADDFAQDKCSYFYVPTALSQIVGFPMDITESRSGINTTVVKVSENPSIKNIVFPEKILPLSDATYVSFLKKYLNHFALASYLRTEHQLTSETLKVKSLRHLLADPRNRKSFAKVQSTSLDMEHSETFVIKDMTR